MKRYPWLLAGLIALNMVSAADQTEPFEFLDGDRVLLIGDTLIEREQEHGQIESLLTVQFPDRDYTFRNLGWSADLPNGRSRASFDWNRSPDVWFQKLTNQVAIVDPTVVFVGYGMAASFEGPEGVETFTQDLNRLIDAIQANASDDVRFVLLSPIAHQNLKGAVTTGTRHNETLKLYVDAISSVAESQDARFINLFNPVEDVAEPDEELVLTSNGIHLTRFGYSGMAEVIADQLGWEPNSMRMSITRDGELRPGSYGGEFTDIERDNLMVAFNAKADQLMAPAYTDRTGSVVNLVNRIRLQFLGLIRGVNNTSIYELIVDGKGVTYADADTWGQSLKISAGPDFHQAEELRRAIIKKNKLFMNRWRPQNETYLFGFRKHEQGQNAGEIPLFDEDVAKADAEIAVFKKPKTRRYELHLTDPNVKWPRETSADRQPFRASSSIPPHTVDPTPDVEFEIADGFEITLFAEDPLIAKPIQMNWDASGRLIVASSETYPQIAPGATTNDKIIALTDTNGDGVADFSRVLIDGLLIPTGVEPGDGGYYVAEGTQLLHVRDRNHDLAVEGVDVVQSAFGTEDTHHLLHTLRWGLDGRLYMNQSIYIHSHIETPTGVVRLNSGGVLAYRPPTDEIEVFLRGFCNPWGHVFDEYGQSFVTDGAGFQGVSWGVPQAMYFTYAGAPRLLDSVSPGSYPKFAGLEKIYTPNFPDDWQGDLITSDFRAHRIVRFKLEEVGAGYVTREMPDLLRTTDVTFRPIDVKLGPDGALYIADWANPIIQHGEVDFRDKRRDKTSGRIWRIARKGGPVEAAMNYQYLPVEQLLDKLNSPNAHIRKIAGRVLAERRDELGVALPEWTRNRGTELEQLRALWVYQSIDRINPGLLKDLLEANEPRVRAGATRVLAQWQEWMEGSEELLAARSQDEHPRVRLEAIRGLARRPSASSAELILAAVEKPMDRFLEYAAWLSVNEVADAWVNAIETNQWNPAGREKQLEFGLRSIKPALASRILAGLLPRELPANGDGGWIELIGSAGTVKELDQLLSQLNRGGFDSPVEARVLNALNTAARTRSLKPGANREAITLYFDSGESDVRQAAIRLSGAWRESGKAIENLAAIAAANTTGADERQLAFNAMQEIGGTDCVEALLPLTSEGNPLEIRQPAVAALSAIDVGKAAPIVVEVLNAIDAENDALALWRDVLRKRGAATVVASAIGRTTLKPTAAAAGLRVVREGGREEPELLQLLTLIANASESSDREMTSEDLLALAKKVMANGDPSRGEGIYRRSELGCVMCHAIGGAGGKVGPDLTSIGASAPPDYLVESLVYPNRKIKEGYHSVVVETTDDFEYSGVLVGETDTELVIRNAANQETKIPKNDIVRRTMGAASLMPAGLVDQLSEQDRLDLYRFLAELGKPGDFDASKGNVARQWKLRPASHRDEQFGASGNMEALLDEPGWIPAFTRVDGGLEQQVMKDALQVSNPNAATSMVGLWAAVPFKTTSSGEIALTTKGLEGAEVWIDGQEVDVKKEIRYQSEVGDHTLLIKLPPRNLPGELRVSADNAAFLTE